MGPESPDEVVRCIDLGPEIERWEARGARLEAIWPADDPGHALVRDGARLVELVTDRPAPPVDAGERRLLVSRPGGSVAGRAGMQYRDLIPGRLGGRYIASSIRIPDGGPVPDYVHHHDVEFQLIFCAAGWVRVVYEDQGPPFVLQPGDGVLQPPGIRHRVLEASPGLEVIEISSPAAHVTHRDHSLTLPTVALRPDRDFGGQRFVHHVAEGAALTGWRGTGLPCRDLGLTAVTNGPARALVLGDVRLAEQVVAESAADADLTFLYVLDGSVHVDVDGTVVDARPATAIVVPPGAPFRLRSWTADLRLLDVAVGLDG
jgi:mannose-6-phosphate isomerase-like protein (cupin superfamily)